MRLGNKYTYQNILVVGLRLFSVMFYSNLIIAGDHQLESDRIWNDEFYRNEEKLRKLQNGKFDQPSNFANKQVKNFYENKNHVVLSDHQSPVDSRMTPYPCSISQKPTITPNCQNVHQNSNYLNQQPKNIYDYKDKFPISIKQIPVGGQINLKKDPDCNFNNHKNHITTCDRSNSSGTHIYDFEDNNSLIKTRSIGNYADKAKNYCKNISYPKSINNLHESQKTHTTVKANFQSGHNIQSKSRNNHRDFHVNYLQDQQSMASSYAQVYNKNNTSCSLYKSFQNYGHVDLDEKSEIKPQLKDLSQLQRYDINSALHQSEQLVTSFDPNLYLGPSSSEPRFIDPGHFQGFNPNFALPSPKQFCQKLGELPNFHQKMHDKTAFKQSHPNSTGFSIQNNSSSKTVPTYYGNFQGSDPNVALPPTKQFSQNLDQLPNFPQHMQDKTAFNSLHPNSTGLRIHHNSLNKTVPEYYGYYQSSNSNNALPPPKKICHNQANLAYSQVETQETSYLSQLLRSNPLPRSNQLFPSYDRDSIQDPSSSKPIFTNQLNFQSSDSNNASNTPANLYHNSTGFSNQNNSSSKTVPTYYGNFQGSDPNVALPPPKQFSQNLGELPNFPQHMQDKTAFDSLNPNSTGFRIQDNSLSKTVPEYYGYYQSSNSNNALPPPKKICHNQPNLAYSQIETQETSYLSQLLRSNTLHRSKQLVPSYDRGSIQDPSSSKPIFTNQLNFQSSDSNNASNTPVNLYHNSARFSIQDNYSSKTVPTYYGNFQGYDQNKALPPPKQLCHEQANLTYSLLETQGKIDNSHLQRGYTLPGSKQSVPSFNSNLNLNSSLSEPGFIDPGHFQICDSNDRSTAQNPLHNHQVTLPNAQFNIPNIRDPIQSDKNGAVNDSIQNSNFPKTTTIKNKDDIVEAHEEKIQISEILPIIHKFKSKSCNFKESSLTNLCLINKLEHIKQENTLSFNKFKNKQKSGEILDQYHETFDKSINHESAFKGNNKQKSNLDQADEGTKIELRTISLQKLPISQSDHKEVMHPEYPCMQSESINVPDSVSFTDPQKIFSENAEKDNKLSRFSIAEQIDLEKHYKKEEQSVPVILSTNPKNYKLKISKPPIEKQSSSKIDLKSKKISSKNIILKDDAIVLISRAIYSLENANSENNSKEIVLHDFSCKQDEPKIESNSIRSIQTKNLCENATKENNFSKFPINEQIDVKKQARLIKQKHDKRFDTVKIIEKTKRINTGIIIREYKNSESQDVKSKKSLKHATKPDNLSNSCPYKLRSRNLSINIKPGEIYKKIKQKLCNRPDSKINKEPKNASCLANSKKNLSSTDLTKSIDLVPRISKRLEIKRNKKKKELMSRASNFKIKNKKKKVKRDQEFIPSFEDLSSD